MLPKFSLICVVYSGAYLVKWKVNTCVTARINTSLLRTVLYLISSSGNYTLNAYKRTESTSFIGSFTCKQKLFSSTTSLKLLSASHGCALLLQALSAAAFTLVTPLKTRLHSDFTKKGFVLFFDHDYNALSHSAELRYH